MDKKNSEILTNIKKWDDFLVQRSIPLYALWKSNLTLAEFKILDFYLSRINSRKPDARIVVIKKTDLEALLGVTKINNEELKLRLKHLMSNVVEIPDSEEDDGFRLLTLFEESTLRKNEFGEQYVELECTQKAMKYIFNIEHLGYLKYKLRCVTSITSRYSYIMFIYLETNRFRGSWEIEIEPLKQMLNCETEKTYEQFKRFNDLILKRVYNELNDKTECKYNYEPVKRGRKVVAIRFTVLSLSKLIMNDINESVEAKSEKFKNSDTYRAPGRLWEDAVEEFNFSKAQLDELHSIIICIPYNKLPCSENLANDIEFRWFHYMSIKAASIKRRDNVKDVYSYLLKILKKDANI